MASHIVQALLAKDYEVVGTVRNLGDPSKFEHLKLLPNSHNLTLVEADNTVPKSFEAAFQGCSAVIHTASPFFHPTPDQTEDFLYQNLVVPAVSGVKNCMGAALACNIKKVVLTSSVAAIWGSQREKNPQHVYSEVDWNDVTKIGYSYSKTLAEKAAWDFVKEHPEIKLVTINPSFNLGPVPSKRSSESVEWMKMFFNLATVKTGMVENCTSDGVHSGILSFVDVRTVAQAHVAALEREQASGRYLLSNTAQHTFLDAAKILAEEFPTYQIPIHLKAGHIDKVPLPIANDHSKAERDLGVKFPPWRDTLVDMVNSMIDLNMIPQK